MHSTGIGNQVWHCQYTKAKVTLWSVDITEVVPEQRPLNGWVCVIMPGLNHGLQFPAVA